MQFGRWATKLGFSFCSAPRRPRPHSAEASGPRSPPGAEGVQDRGASFFFRDAPRRQAPLARGPWACPTWCPSSPWGPLGGRAGAGSLGPATRHPSPVPKARWVQRAKAGLTRPIRGAKAPLASAESARGAGSGGPSAVAWGPWPPGRCAARRIQCGPHRPGVSSALAALLVGAAGVRWGPPRHGAPLFCCFSAEGGPGSTPKAAQCFGFPALMESGCANAVNPVNPPSPESARGRAS